MHAKTSLLRPILHSSVALNLGLLMCGTRSEGSTCDLNQVPYCTWAWSNNEFFDVGDTGALINFETLPNGAPSFGGAAITPAFNYVLQGALFSSALPSLFIGGNTQIGFGLTAHNSSPIAHNSIIAQLTLPERGVGVSVIGQTTLFAYDAQGSLITSVSYDDPNGIRYFLGIKSSVPIARVVIDRGQNTASLDDFTMIHVSVPDPASTALLLIAAPILFRRRSRRGRIGVARNV